MLCCAKRRFQERWASKKELAPPEVSKVVQVCMRLAGHSETMAPSEVSKVVQLPARVYVVTCTWHRARRIESMAPFRGFQGGAGARVCTAPQTQGRWVLGSPAPRLPACRLGSDQQLIITIISVNAGPRCV